MWQPIETASKDGEFLLTFTPHWGVDIERWNGREWTADLDDGPSERDAPDPTHWMPLPAPPTR
jgi:hypothetical protein